MTGQFTNESDFEGTILKGEGAFLAKYSNNGSLQWIKQIDAVQGIYPQRIMVALNGDVLLAGALYSTVDFGCSTLTPTQSNTKFITRYNSSCQWGTSFVASYLFGFTIDKNDNVFVTGGFLGQGIFDTITITADFQDIYVAKCDGNGNWLWALAIGGPSEDQGHDIDTDNSGNIIVTGFFAENVTFGNTTLTSTGANDIFVASFNQQGICNWAQQAGGGSGNQYGFSLDVDTSGNAMITGSIIDVTHFGNQTITPNGEKSYFAGYDRNGAVLWALSTSGVSGDRGLDISAYNGNLYAVGEFYGEGSYTFGQTTLDAKRSEIYISKIKYPGRLFTSIIPENAVGLQYSHNAWVDFLGNFYLCAIDSEHEFNGIPYARYVDDIYIFFSSRIEAAHHLIKLSRILRKDGLTLNEAKTRIFEVEELVYEENEFDELFENAREELMWLASQDHNGYGFSMNFSDLTLDSDDYDELEFKALITLFDKFEVSERLRNKIDKFCIPFFASQSDNHAFDYVKDNFVSKPEMAQIFSKYLISLINFEDISPAVQDLINKNLDLFEYQKLWLYTTLLYTSEPIFPSTIKLIIGDLKNFHLSEAVRAICAMIIGKFGKPPHQRILRNHYSLEPSEYVKSALIYSVRDFPDRDTCFTAWSGHSEINSLIVTAIKNLEREK